MYVITIRQHCRQRDRQTDRQHSHSNTHTALCEASLGKNWASYTYDRLLAQLLLTVPRTRRTINSFFFWSSDDVRHRPKCQGNEKIWFDKKIFLLARLNK